MKKKTNLNHKCIQMTLPKQNMLMCNERISVQRRKKREEDIDVYTNDIERIRKRKRERERLIHIKEN